MAPAFSLRPVEPDDLPVLFAHQCDAESARLAAFPPRDREAFMAHWAKIMADPTLDARTVLAGGRVAGHIGSWTSDSDRMIGYWVGREFWGQGIATAALSQFLQQTPHRPLVALVAKHNLGSIRVLQKCGFLMTGEHAFVGRDGQSCAELIFKLGAPPAYASPACAMPEIED